MKYVLAFDQGTTSCRSIVFDETGQPISIGQREFRQIFPKSGWVEHDASEIWRVQVDTAREALYKAKISFGDVSAIGITNQRETVVVWDRTTGEPLANAIVWQDRRTSDLCDRIREIHGELIRDKTGLEVDAYFSASKINWLLENVEGLRERAENGNALVGTIDSWLVWKLTNGLHVTDVSNASRTMLFNIKELAWDSELLNIYGIPHMWLPKPIASSGVVAEAVAIDELSGVPIGGIAGDQQAALYGQGCFSRGDVKNTYGTGCFMLQNTGERPQASHNRLLTTIGWQIGGVTTYALEGSVFIGGAVVQWLRDQLGIIGSSAEIEELAGSVADSGGVFFVPAFAGLGTPYWDQDARGTIYGLTRGSTKAHIARAAIESMAFQTTELLIAMNADSGSELTELRVDGGASDNDLLLQTQADILQIPVVRSAVSETTALGAAYLAGLATGVWRSEAELASHWKENGRFEPQISAAEAETRISGWRDAVGRSLGRRQ